MSVQYETVVDWDSTLIDLEFTDTENSLVKGLVKSAVKITTGVPAATAGKFMKSAQIYNAFDGTWYQNTGTVASPIWTVNGTGPASIPLAEGSILVGNSGGVAAAVSAKTDARILVGNGTTIGSVPLSGEATLVNSGAVTLDNGAVIGKVLTGYTPTTNTSVAATDSILAAMGKVGGEIVKTAKISVSSGEILTLNSVGKVLLPAPAAGTINQILGVFAKLNYGSAAYQTNTVLEVFEVGTALFDNPTLLALGATALQTFAPVASGEFSAASDVFLKTKTGDPTNGDGTLDVYVTYKTVTL